MRTFRHSMDAGQRTLHGLYEYLRQNPKDKGTYRVQLQSVPGKIKPQKGTQCLHYMALQTIQNCPLNRIQTGVNNHGISGGALIYRGIGIF